VTKICFGQVDRARVGVETLRDEINDVPERLVQVVRPRDDLGNVGK